MQNDEPLVEDEDDDDDDEDDEEDEAEGMCPHSSLMHIYSILTSTLYIFLFISRVCLFKLYVFPDSNWKF